MMNGVNLDWYLRLVQWDWGQWLSLTVLLGIVSSMLWASVGTRRLLRRCLVFSIAAHLAIVMWGSRSPIVQQAVWPNAKGATTDRIQTIQMLPWSDYQAGLKPGEGRMPSAGRRLADWDQPLRTRTGAGKENVVATARAALGTAALPPSPVNRDETGLTPLADPKTAQEPPMPTSPPSRLALNDPGETARREADAPKTPAPPRNEDLGATSKRRAAPDTPKTNRSATAERLLPRPEELLAPGPNARTDRNASAQPMPLPTRPDEPPITARAPETPLLNANANANVSADSDPASKPAAGDLPNAARDNIRTETKPSAERRPARGPRLAEPDVLGRLRAQNAVGKRDGNSQPLALRVPGAATSAAADGARDRARNGERPRVADPGRWLEDVPEVYRFRLDPNRSLLAQRAGATEASEQSVELALDWLARHQDADGRWDGGSRNTAEGAPLAGEDDFTIHCRSGEVCFGPCLYWEADTALTGLSLLSFLGAGYTQTHGTYAATVRKGLNFLVSQQRPDGDLRGGSRSVGMYCHGIASLAICEAYALTQDPQLKEPARLAVQFIVNAQSAGGLGWRYEPRARLGDTSVFGWMVMVLKSGKMLGFDVPDETRAGALRWLDLVAEGPNRGLARYQPREPASPTMTAEAWVARQFLGVGGAGPQSDEAAAYVLRTSPRTSQYNLYYWYYGTLAMYQHGGAPWKRWNEQVREELVRRQRSKGCLAGSWDPDESEYGRRGGRIYTTALAAMTLEVYYRYLRLYESPANASGEVGRERTAQ